MKIDFEIKDCHCCFPFYCGHKKIIIDSFNLDLLMMALKYSTIIKKESVGE